MTTYNDYISQAQTYMQNAQANDPAFQAWQADAARYTPDMGPGPAWEGRDYFSEWMQSLPDKGADYLQQYQAQKAKDAKSFTGRLGQLMSFIPAAVGTIGLAGASGLLGGTALGNAAGFPAAGNIFTGAAGAGAGAAAEGTLAGVMGDPATAAAWGSGAGLGADTLSAMGLSGAGGVPASVAAALEGTDALMGAGLPAAGLGGSSGGSYTNPAYTAIPSVASTMSGPSVTQPSPIDDFFSKLKKGIGTAGGISNIVSGLAGLYGDYRAQSDYRDAASNLQNLFGDDSAYAQNLRKELQRRDAAAGRRSQYGPRSVELQAKLAELAARNTPSLINLFDKQSNARNDSLKSLLDILNASGMLPTPRLP